MIGATCRVTTCGLKKFCSRTLRQRDRPAAGPAPPRRPAGACLGNHCLGNHCLDNHCPGNHCLDNHCLDNHCPGNHCLGKYAALQHGARAAVRGSCGLRPPGCMPVSRGSCGSCRSCAHTCLCGSCGLRPTRSHAGFQLQAVNRGFLRGLMRGRSWVPRVGHRFQAWWVMWATPTRHTPYTIRIVAYTSNFD